MSRSTVMVCPFLVVFVPIVAKLAGLYDNSGRCLAPALQFSAVLGEISRFSDLRLAVPDYFYYHLY